jgi:hypothetical protein
MRPLGYRFWDGVDRGTIISSAILAFAVVLNLHAIAVAQTASLDLLRRAINPNPTLNSYTASAQLSATLHVVVPVHKNFNGTVYYLRPKREILFQGVSGALSKFKDLVSSTPTYDEAMAQYTITPLTDNGTISTYSAVPKKAGGRIKSIIVTVNDQSALVTGAKWSYTNGGTLTFNQTYTNVGDFRLAAQATIAARFPGYSVDGTITFAGYQPNATVAPSVFATPQ